MAAKGGPEVRIGGAERLSVVERIGGAERISGIDRRVIYVLLIAVIAFALIRPVGLAIRATPETMKVHDAISGLPSGSILWMGFEFDAGAVPELMPAAEMVIRDAFDKDLRIVSGGMWQMAGDLGMQAFDAVLPDYPDKRYGIDFVNIGYRPGRDLWLDQMTRDAWVASSGVDVTGTSFTELPLMAEFRSLKDAKFLMVFVTGTPGTPEYIKVVSAPLGKPLGVSCTSVEAPGTMPYLSSGQVVGGILGMKGAAEYETLLGRPGLATAGMDAQSFAHALIVLLILLGNAGYLIERRSKQRRGVRCP
ncbi:MAG: hypothetical protein ACM3WU_04950 [Bacillota bacterium]